MVPAALDRSLALVAAGREPRLDPFDERIHDRGLELLAELAPRGDGSLDLLP